MTSRSGGGHLTESGLPAAGRVRDLGRLAFTKHLARLLADGRHGDGTVIRWQSWLLGRCSPSDSARSARKRPVDPRRWASRSPSSARRPHRSRAEEAHPARFLGDVLPMIMVSSHLATGWRSARGGGGDRCGSDRARRTQGLRHLPTLINSPLEDGALAPRGTHLWGRRRRSGGASICPTVGTGDSVSSVVQAWVKH